MKIPIKFNHIRYVLPCILFPFSALIYGATKDKFGTPNAEKPKDPTEINAQLQDPDLEKTQTMNKFDALFNAYEHKEDFSAIKGIEGEEGKNLNLELDNKDLYSMSEMDKINAMNGQNNLGTPKAKGVSNFDMYKNATAANSLNVPKYTPTYTYKSPRQPNEFESYVNAMNPQESSRTVKTGNHQKRATENTI